MVTAGGEIDAWCTKCKRELNHTIVAVFKGSVQRVECTTCAGQHSFRPRAPRAPVAAEAKAKPVTRRRKAVDPALADESVPARGYQMTETFILGEMLLHPSLGRGRVTGVRGTKVDVEFTTGPRTLAHEPKR